MLLTSMCLQVLALHFDAVARGTDHPIASARPAIAAPQSASLMSPKQPYQSDLLWLSLAGRAVKRTVRFAALLPIPTDGKRLGPAGQVGTVTVRYREPVIQTPETILAFRPATAARQQKCSFLIFVSWKQNGQPPTSRSRNPVPVFCYSWHQ